VLVSANGKTKGKGGATPRSNSQSEKKSLRNCEAVKSNNLSGFLVCIIVLTLSSFKSRVRELIILS